MSNLFNIDFNKMCDLCYEQMKEEEELFGFHVTDVNEIVRMFKGHSDCVNIMAEMFREVYGESDDNEDNHVEE